jgi:hypothetical protein
VAIAASVLCVGIFQNTCAWVNATRHTPNLPLGSYFGLIWGPMTICVGMLALIGVLRAASVGAELPALLRLLAYVSVGAVFYVAVASVFAREGVLAALQATRVMFTARSAKA